MGSCIIKPGTTFSPWQLFARGRQGVWIEPGLNGTLFTTNTGETAASAGSTVGLALDKSRNLALGPELVTNNTFDTDVSSWSVLNGSRGTFASVSGQLVATNNGTNATGPTLYQNITTSQGGLYQVTGIVISSSTTQGARVRIIADGGTSLADFLYTSGPVNYYFVAFRTTTIGVWIYSNNLFNVSVIDNISVRQVLSYCASQTTVANRPTLQQSGNLNFIRHDANDALVVAGLPALSGGNYSTTASVYFGTPQGMSSLHGQTIGTTYNLPAPNTDVYVWVVVPSRLTPPEEEQLARYFRAKAGIVGSEAFLYEQGYGFLAADDGTYRLLRR